MKKILLGLLLLLLAAMLYFASTTSTSEVIDTVAKRYASDYNITYENLSGNLIDGIKIEKLKYKEKTIATNITYMWDPWTLFDKKITISEIDIKDADVDVIKALMGSFSDSNSSSTEPFGYTVDVDTLSVSLNTFKESNITFNSSELKANGIHYSDKELSIEGLDMKVDSNLTYLEIHASVANEKAILETLILKNINTEALLNRFSQTEKDISSKTQDKPQDKRQNKPQNKLKEESAFELPIKEIVFKELLLESQPFDYDPFKIEAFKVEGQNIALDLENLTIVDGAISLLANTNMSNIEYTGTAKNNHLTGKIRLTPHNTLFEHYKIPLRKEAIGQISADIDASRERIKVDLQAKAKHILQNKKGEFNIDIENLSSQIEYGIKSKALTAKTKTDISTPYAKDIHITNTLHLSDTLSYSGKVTSKSLQLPVDEKLSKLFDHIAIDYQGSDNALKVLLNNKQFHGALKSEDLKTGHFNLETKQSILLKDFITLPEKLVTSKAAFKISSPIDFAAISNLNIKANITSNLLNLDSHIKYGERVEIDGNATLPSDSLLTQFDQNLKTEALFPMRVKVAMGEKKSAKNSIKITSKFINSELTLSAQEKISGRVNLDGLTVNIKGKKSDLELNTHIKSLALLKKSISNIYTIEALPPVEGSIKANANIKEMKRATLLISSPKLTYKEGRKKPQTLTDLNFKVRAEEGKLSLESYALLYNKQKFFSTKASQVEMDGSKINILSMWLNDALKINGDYDLETKKGVLFSQARNMRINDENVDMFADVDLVATIDGNETNVDGKIVLLGGKIKYDISKKSFAKDSDIIIIQEMRKKKPSSFMKNLSTNIQIETKKPLLLQQKNINIKLKPDINILKAKNEKLMMLGSVEMMKGSSYIFEKKKFKLSKSQIHFTGNPEKPILDIKVKYKSLDHLITILVSGPAASPQFNFSSSPSLSKEQILSVILFDSPVGGDTYSGNEMMKMMGGSLAKSALSDMGIEIDHLVFGEGNSVEVGKKLTNKITIIYINGELPQVKLKYKHGTHTESIIGVSEESQSYDIIYKGDF